MEICFRREDTTLPLFKWWMTVCYSAFDASSIAPKLTRFASWSGQLDILTWAYEQSAFEKYLAPDHLRTIICKKPEIAYFLHEHTKGLDIESNLSGYADTSEYAAILDWVTDLNINIESSFNMISI